ncbi:MAG: ribonuclease Y [Clostridiales bacterium]|jgi:ribonuclease Y|nr:ribonuclease Y [Clostridiales bacterium]
MAGLLLYLPLKIFLKNKQKNIKKELNKKSEEIILAAKKEAENLKKEKIFEAGDEIHKKRIEYENEEKERRINLQKQEKRILEKEEFLEKKSQMMDKKEEEMQIKHKNIENIEKKIEIMKIEQEKILEKNARMTVIEAKSFLLKKTEDEMKHEFALLIKKFEEKTKEKMKSRANEIIIRAIQRCSFDYVTESTVSVVHLPNDEVKGRIIGREGRNIRTFETLTGIDLIIDDTPEAVVLSGFEPIRREIARLALEKLILDGRIHPTRIEEMIKKSKKEIEEVIKQKGEQAVLVTCVYGIHPELIKLLGKLKYRTSFGQNVLKHSIEVSLIAGFMASELGENVDSAKRGGLFHDIGKAVDGEAEGSHIEIGAKIAKKYGESEEIINAILSHHDDVTPNSVVAYLVQAADSISAARPGARRENVENYIERLRKIEEICNSYKGVENAYAVQAGREVRIIVKPCSLNDDECIILARKISERIENEIDYPGQIKVNVIREFRTTDYAT